MKININDQSLREKIHALSLGDSSMEKDLSVLYYKSIQEIRDKYTEGIVSMDLNLIRFISHKYQSTFHTLHLTELADEISHGKHLVVSRENSEQLIRQSMVKVKTLCDQTLAQLRHTYPWLKKGVR